MEIDKKHLKLISMEFRTIANRLINCNHQTGMDLLKKFLAYIEDNELISEYIKGFVNPEDFSPVEPGVSYISTGDTKKDEISFTYQYLKYCSITFRNYYRDMACNYAREANDAVKEFNNRIILPFVNYIESYLTEIGIRMGYDEDVKYLINVNGGTAQVNVANDNAIVNASQSNGVDLEQLEKLILSLKTSVPSVITDEESELLNDSIETIQNELQCPKPKKGLIRTALAGLNAIKGGAEFAAAVIAIYQFVQPLIG